MCMMDYCFIDQLIFFGVFYCFYCQGVCLQLGVFPNVSFFFCFIRIKTECGAQSLFFFCFHFSVTANTNLVVSRHVMQGKATATTTKKAVFFFVFPP